jgi:hypothetical protein
MPPWTWLEKADGGPVEMATGGTTPTSTGGQYQPRESEGPGFFRNNDNYENSGAGGINFVKNFVQGLSPAQREAQRLVSEATKKSGKEALVFGRGENPNDLAKLTQGTYENVSLPSNYAQYALQSADPFYSFHTHATNTLSPSAADLRIWGATQPGTIGLPYQSMFINASPQDSLLRIGEPGKWMDSDAQRLVQEVLNLKDKNEDLVANHGFMDPRMREFWKGNKLPDLAHTFHAESDQMPGVKNYLDKKIPGAAQGASMRDLYAGNFLQRIAELGIPVDVSAEHRIAGTPYLAQDVWPEFAAHVKKHALPKAEGGPVEMGGGGAEKIKQAAGWLRRKIMPHARQESKVPPNRDIESRYWDHKKPPDLDTITADYADHPPVDVPTMKIEDIKGGRLFAIPHDRSATDITLGGYNGNTFADPVTSPGGPLYAFGRNPEAVTASGESVIKKLHESALRSADEGRTPYLAPWLMGPHGVDFSTHMNEAVVQSLPFLKVPSAKKDEVNAMLSTVFKDFPGIDHNDLAQYLHSMVGTTRRDLPKLLDKGEMVNAGLDVGGLRAALTEPSLLHAPYGSSGAAISRIDPSKSPTMFGYPNHPSYPWQLQGTPVGGLDPLVPSQILYPDIYRTLPPETQLGPKGRPVNNRRAFEMKSMLGDVYQDVNDEVINGVNEYQEYMRKLRGWKEGGTVEDQYHPIWQQSFAGGGQPDDEKRGFYTLKEKYANKRRENAERLAQEDVEIKRDLGGHYRDMATQIPRGWASILEIPGLVGDALNLRADYLDSVAPGSSPMRIPHWGTSEGISKGLDSVFPETTSRYGGETGRALGEMSLNMLGLGAANKARGVMQGLGNSANLAATLFGGPSSGEAAPDEEWQAPPRLPRGYEQFVDENAPDWQRYNPTTPTMAHGGPVGYVGGGPVVHAKDTGNTFDFLGNFDGGLLGGVADIAGGIFNGEDVDLRRIAGNAGQALGTLLGMWAGVPGIGGPLGRGVGEIGADLIEPGEGGDIGQDALRAGTGALRGGMGMFFAHGGSTGFLPQDREGQDPNDLTRFLAPLINPSEQPDPMEQAASNGIPGAVAPPLMRVNPQQAQNDAERQRLMAQAEASSKQALQSQNKPKGGGGLMDMLGPLLQIGGMMSGMGGVTAGAPLDFGMGGAGRAAAGGLSGGFMPGFESGGPVSQDGEQPWMYGDGALMARGGYLRGCGGMNG